MTAETLKKLGIAPNNESYVINILRFIGAIDEAGNRTSAAAATFSKHDSKEFADAFASLVKPAYKELFSLHGDAAWTLDSDKLISFFRGSDKSSDLVGRRQASTFQVLSSFAGHGEIPTAKVPSISKASGERSAKPKPKNKERPASATPDEGSVRTPEAVKGRDFGLTVRIEVNLPAAGDQETYDKIFRSIRENLLNAK